MPATTPPESHERFTVHVDPDELQLRQFGTPARQTTDRQETAARRTTARTHRDTAPTPAHPSTRSQPRAYPYRRS